MPQPTKGLVQMARLQQLSRHKMVAMVMKHCNNVIQGIFFAVDQPSHQLLLDE
jgi:hypothetical protein